MKGREAGITGAVMRAVVTELAKAGKGRYVVGAVSNRHVHLSAEDKEALFGAGYELRRAKELVQPGQYASEEKVSIIGPKGRIDKVRVLGPERAATQVEISVTDAYRLGLRAEVRMSGEVTGTPGCVLEASGRRVELAEGVIVSARHLHMSPSQAAAYGLKDGEKVRLKSGGERAAILERVVVRSGAEHELEAHVDMDEANAAGIKNGDLLEII